MNYKSIKSICYSVFILYLFGIFALGCKRPKQVEIVKAEEIQSEKEKQKEFEQAEIVKKEEIPGEKGKQEVSDEEVIREEILKEKYKEDRFGEHLVRREIIRDGVNEVQVLAVYDEEDELWYQVDAERYFYDEIEHFGILAVNKGGGMGITTYAVFHTLDENREEWEKVAEFSCSTASLKLYKGEDNKFHLHADVSHSGAEIDYVSKDNGYTWQRLPGRYVWEDEYVQ